MGGAAPRILSLDAYFYNEVEKTVKDPDTGRRYVWTKSRLIFTTFTTLISSS